MDVNKEREAFENWYKIQNGSEVSWGDDGIPLGYEKAIAWSAWQAAKAQAVPDSEFGGDCMKWIDYEKQVPQQDGRYQIFVAGEQLTADYSIPFGFLSAEDGCAFIQDRITHWMPLPEPPKLRVINDKVKSVWL